MPCLKGYRYYGYMPGFHQIADVMVEEEIHYPDQTQPDNEHDCADSSTIEQDGDTHHDGEQNDGYQDIEQSQPQLDPAELQCL